MTDDVMARLMAVQPLPRGERVARIFDSLDARENISHYPGRNYLEASHLGVLNDIFLIDGDTSLAVQLTREWAAPLRKCREQRQRLRSELVVERETLFRLRNATEKGGEHDHKGDP